MISLDTTFVAIERPRLLNAGMRVSLEITRGRALRAAMLSDMQEYRPQSSDCSVTIDRVVFERIRAMSPGERLRAVSEACIAADRLQIAGLRLQYPSAGEEELRRRAAARRVGREFLVRFLGAEAEAWLD